MRPLRRMAPALSAWLPTTDIYTKDGQVVVKVELPGMKKEDIEVTLEQGDLVIRGERTAESEAREEEYYRAEREAGRIHVAVHDGTVTLSGHVRSWREKQAILGAAGHAPGVRGVDDKVRIEPWA